MSEREQVAIVWVCSFCHGSYEQPRGTVLLSARAWRAEHDELQRLRVRTEADAKVIAELRLERDAAHAGGEELQAALVLANQTISELRTEKAHKDLVIADLRCNLRSVTDFNRDRDQHIKEIDAMLDGIHKDREEED